MSSDDCKSKCNVYEKEEKLGNRYRSDNGVSVVTVIKLCFFNDVLKLAKVPSEEKMNKKRRRRRRRRNESKERF